MRLDPRCSDSDFHNGCGVKKKEEVEENETEGEAHNVSKNNKEKQAKNLLTNILARISQYYCHWL